MPSHAGQPQEDRLQPKTQEGANRWILGCGVDERAAERGDVEYASDGQRNDGDSVWAERQLERYLLEQRPHGDAA